MPHETTSTRALTDSLKGIGILIVIANHKLNTITPLYVGYGNAVLSVFFILSGYGIYHSLQKRGGLSFYEPVKILSFFKRKFARIISLYAIAVLLIGKEFGGGFWFINAILFCYLLTPTIYNIVVNQSFRANVLIVLGLTLFLVAASQFIVEVFNERFLFYR